MFKKGGEKRFRTALKKRKEEMDGRDAGGVDEWIAALESLFLKIDGWLAPFVTEGLLQVHHRTVPINNDDCSPYKAPCLRITDTAGSWSVDFFPTARYVIGNVTGRVDIPFGAVKHTLLRHGLGETAEWTLRDDRIRGVPSTEADFVGKPLKKDHLFDVLGDLVDKWNASY